MKNSFHKFHSYLLIGSFLGLTLGLRGQEQITPPNAEVISEVRLIPVAPGQLDFSETANGRIISRSEQFRVYGGTVALRGKAANAAEDIKSEYSVLLGDKKEWKVPIIVRLMGKKGDPVPKRLMAMKIAAGEMGYEVQLFVNLSQGFQKEQFEEQTFKALIFAASLEGKPALSLESRLRVPPWIVQGIKEAAAWSAQKGNRKFYEILFEKGGLFKLEELFSMKEAEYQNLDSASKLAFTVSASALVMALIEQPEGQVGMQGFLGEIAPFSGETPLLLRRHFPDLNLSQNSLRKWWALQLATKGEVLLTEAMTVAETEALLEEALNLIVFPENGDVQSFPINEWKRLDGLEDDEKVQAVRPALDRLIRLSFRSFPSYRPILDEYRAVLNKLALGKNQDIDETLAMLQDNRTTMKTKTEQARDFLDWFEITRARRTSGAFADYLKLKSELKTKRSSRTDPMTKYLDQFEPLFRMPDGSSQYGLSYEPLPF